MQTEGILNAVSESPERVKWVVSGAHLLITYTGLICAGLIFCSFLTGLLISLPYSGDVRVAYESVSFLSTRISFGWLLRSAHFWSGKFLAPAAAIYLLGLLALNLHKGKGAIGWMTGFLSLVAIAVLEYSGGLLSWNLSNLFAYKAGAAILEKMPVVGGFFASGFSPEVFRSYVSMHIYTMPIFLSGLLAVHIFWAAGNLPRTADNTGSYSFVKAFVVLMAVLQIIAILSVMIPVDMDIKADESLGITPWTKPSWLLMPLFTGMQILSDYIHSGFLMFSALMIIFWLFIPLIDRNAVRLAPGWPFYAGAVVFFAYCILLLLGEIIT